MYHIGIIRRGGGILLKKHRMEVLINGNGYAFSIVSVIWRLFIVWGRGKTSINSLGNQTIQNYCN